MAPKFEKEVEKFGKAQGVTSSKHSADLLREEKRLRPQVDVACRLYAETLGWPLIPKEEKLLLELMNARLFPALEFGQWLDFHLRISERKPLEEWLVFLLVDSWPMFGIRKWSEWHSDRVKGVT